MTEANKNNSEEMFLQENEVEDQKEFDFWFAHSLVIDKFDPEQKKLYAEFKSLSLEDAQREMKLLEDDQETHSAASETGDKARRLIKALEHVIRGIRHELSVTSQDSQVDSGQLSSPLKGLPFADHVSDKMLDDFVYELGQAGMIKVDYQDINARTKVVHLLKTGDGKVEFNKKHGSLKDAFFIAKHLPIKTSNKWYAWCGAFTHEYESFNRQPNSYGSKKRESDNRSLLEKVFGSE